MHQRHRSALRSLLSHINLYNWRFITLYSTKMLPPLARWGLVVFSFYKSHTPCSVTQIDYHVLLRHTLELTAGVRVIWTSPWSIVTSRYNPRFVAFIRIRTKSIFYYQIFLLYFLIVISHFELCIPNIVLILRIEKQLLLIKSSLNTSSGVKINNKLKKVIIVVSDFTYDQSSPRL